MKWASFDIIILWWGLAGLSSALYLSDRKPNLSLCIIEAKDRIWGRVHSQDMGNELFAEIWAEWIGKNHKALLKLCKRFWLELIKHDQNFAIQVNDHRHKYSTRSISKYNQSALQDFLQQFTSFKDKKILDYDHRSIEDLFLHIFKNNQNDLNIEDILNSNEYGSNMKTVSASKFIIDTLQWEETDGMDFKIQGGNESLIQALYRLLKERNITIMKNTKVLNISQKNKTYSMCTNIWHIYKSKYIISSLPTKAMSLINRNNLLSLKKQNYIHSISNGNIMKWWSIFNKWSMIQWKWICNNGLLHTIYDAWYGQYNQQNHWKQLVWVYTTWERAMILSSLQDKEIKKEVEQSLWIIDHCDSKFYRYHWGEDQDIHGAYAVFYPWTFVQWIKILQKREGNISFCWEHTSLWYQWFMNGAITSWYKAAKEILHSQRKK